MFNFYMTSMITKSLVLQNTLNENISEFLDYLIANGGPELQDYEKFTYIVNNLVPNEVAYFRERIKTVLNENTLIGHGFVKPFGYPGDFTLIDKIYRYDVNQDARYKNWDLFFQNQPGANAVRNRKAFFIEYSSKLISKKENAKVLILGSGPASDVYEFLSNFSGGNNINIDLIDFDQSAIDFSMKKNEKFNGQISYNKINALRFNSYKLYD